MLVISCSLSSKIVYVIIKYINIGCRVFARINGSFSMRFYAGNERHIFSLLLLCKRIKKNTFIDKLPLVDHDLVAAGILRPIECSVSHADEL